MATRPVVRAGWELAATRWSLVDANEARVEPLRGSVIARGSGLVTGRGEANMAAASFYQACLSWLWLN